jgi:hypothetical protein
VTRAVTRGPRAARGDPGPRCRIEIPLDKLERRPRYELATLAKPEEMARLQKAVAFWMGRVREMGQAETEA